MAERRKIIIETGAEADEPLSTPHFDTEATLTARPVVPLSDQEPYQARYNDYAGRAAMPFWKRPALLALVALVAVGIGIAAGIAIGYYRSSGAPQNPVVAAPTSTVESTASDQVVETPEPESTSQARATVPEESEDVPEKPEEPVVAPKEEERERTTRNERKDRDDDEAVKPPVARDKKPIKVDEYIIEEGREAERERRREERRAERRERRRRQREDEPNLPRQVERAGRELDRIRDIFEGRQP